MHNKTTVLAYGEGFLAYQVSYCCCSYVPSQSKSTLCSSLHTLMVTSDKKYTANNLIGQIFQPPITAVSCL